MPIEQAQGSEIPVTHSIDSVDTAHQPTASTSSAPAASTVPSNATGKSRASCSPSEPRAQKAEEPQDNGSVAATNPDESESSRQTDAGQAAPVMPESGSEFTHFCDPNVLDSGEHHLNDT